MLLRATPGMEGTASAVSLAVQDENRVDEVGARQRGFRDEASQRRRAAAATQAESPGTVRGSMYS